jgi:branched-chain amino acid transport system substrate-binding protein
MIRSSKRRRLAAPAVLVTLGLTLAAGCGGDDDDSTSEPAAEETATAEEPAAAETTAPAEEPAMEESTAEESTMEESTMEESTAEESTMEESTMEESTAEESSMEEPAAEGKVTDYLAYTGGTAGPADDSMEPIRIGYVNQDGGAIVVSSTHDDGVDAAVQLINEELGGIGGHPIEIEQCFIANTDEEGQQCGQTFANDDSIAAVISGPTVTGTQAFYAALDQSKVVVHGVSVSPVDIVQPNVAVLNGGSAYILAPFGTFAQDVMGAESAALVYSEETQSDAAAGQAAAFEALGIPIEVVSYPSSTPDLTVPLLAAGATDADVVMPVIAAPECVKFAEAQRQLGIPDEKVLASPVCLSPATIEGLGDFPNWYYGVTSSLGIDPTDPAIPPYIDVLTAQGREDLIPDPWTLVGFAQTLTLAQWMNDLGADNITTAGLLDEISNFTGPLVLGSPVLECGRYPEAPAMCGDHTQFYKYDSPNFTNASDFIGPPEGWENPSL